MAAPDVRHYPGQATILPDQVDYTFVNNWTATPDLPCRAALRAELPGRVVPCPGGPFAELVVGIDGPELDFSSFRHRPTLIARAFRCRIRGNGPVRLRLATCGGIRLWLDENPFAVFEPFLRNQPQATEVSVTLSGAADLTLRMEDLHERDTVCFFSVTVTDGTAEVALPPGFDADAVSQAAATLASLRTERLFHQAGPITLVADVPPPAPMVLHVPDLGPWERGGLVSDPAHANPVTVTLTADQPRAVLAGVAQAGPGCISIPIETRAGGARVTRHLGTTTLPPGTRLTGDLSARKAQAAALIAAGDGFEPTVAALLAQRGERPDRVAAILDPALTTIEERWDCCDFSILPLLRLWRDARETLPGPLADRMRAAFLTWRYWLDEPGDDVMWFWSENHVLCFHTAQLVAGRLFPDEVFPNSGKTGRQHAAQAHARLIRWFDAIDAHGLCEWNSAAYYPIDLLALFTIHDMAPDLAARAARVMDRIFVMTALHMTGGVPAGSQGRCYEKELLAGPLTELGPVMAIALGDGGGPDFVPGYDRASGLFCLSDYAPPPGLSDLAAPAPGATVAARYTQGHGHTGRLTLWKSAEAQLSTVTDLKTGERGYQVQVVDVQLARHPAARLWLNHPGELKPWGERRPSLLAGSHVMPRAAQDGPVALVIWDIAKAWTDIGFTQAFADPAAFGPPERAGAWRVFAGTVGLWCSAPLDPVQTGLYRGALWRAEAPRVGWAVALRLPGETPAAFAARLEGAAMAFGAADLTLSATGLGPHRLDLLFDGPLRVDGQPRPFGPLSPLPHIARDGGPPMPLEDRDASA
jgi:hypothetical protein